MDVVTDILQGKSVLPASGIASASRPMRVLYVLPGARGGAISSMLAVLRRVPRERLQGYVVVPPSRPEQLREIVADAAVCRSLLMPWWNAKTRLPLSRRPLVWAGAALRSGWHVRPVRTLSHWIREWRIDLVHTSTSQVIDGALAARLTGIPHVWHIREEIGAQGIFRFWLPEPLLARTFGWLSDAIVANSEFTAGFFRRHGLGAQVVVVHNGIDTSAFREGAGCALRERLGIRAENTLVGMVATPTAMMKRHDLFIDMAARLEDEFPAARFVVFGELPEPAGWLHGRHWRYMEALRARVQAHGLKDRFVWAGHCPDVAAMMDAIDILVHPFGREGFGRVAVEAMAAGRPVIGIRSGGVAEIVADGETGFLVDAEAAEPLAAATARLLKDPGLRKAFGACGRELAATRFALDVHVARLMQVYRHAIALRTC